MPYEDHRGTRDSAAQARICYGRGGTRRRAASDAGSQGGHRRRGRRVRGTFCHHAGQRDWSFDGREALSALLQGEAGPPLYEGAPGASTRGGPSVRRYRAIQRGSPAARSAGERRGERPLPLPARHLVRGRIGSGSAGDLGGRGDPEHTRKRKGRRRPSAQGAQSLPAGIRTERRPQHGGASEGSSSKEYFACGYSDRLWL